MTTDLHHSSAASDAWSNWVLHDRCGGDPEYERVARGMMERIRDRVLDGARLEPGMTIADVGTGDGMIAFGAIARVGASLRAILTDISAPLLQCARQRARELDVDRQCIFLQGGADKLQGVADGSIDVAMTRAVLAYLSDKAAAFCELHRVLKPDGRISIAEPIFRDQALETVALTTAFGASPLPEHASASVFLRLMQRWKAAQFPSTEEEIRLSPIANFTERDLVKLAQHAGFVDVHLELHIDVRRSSITKWNVLLDTSPHPLAPTLRTILQSQFSPQERELFERVMRPLVESGKTSETDVVAYLTAVKKAES